MMLIVATQDTIFSMIGLTSTTYSSQTSLVPRPMERGETDYRDLETCVRNPGKERSPPRKNKPQPARENLVSFPVLSQIKPQAPLLVE